MSAIPDRELSRLRADLEGLVLPDTCTVLNKTETPDGMGGVAITAGTVYTNVPFRLDPHKGYEQLGGDSLRPYQEFTGTLPNKYTITMDYQIVHNSVTYNVVSVNAGSWLTCKRVILEKT